MKLFLLSILIFLLSFSLNAQMIFGQVLIKGNILISDKQIRDIILAKKGKEFSSKIINEDMVSIKKLYEKNGFYNVVIYYPDIQTISPENIKVIYKIQENPKLKIIDIRFMGNKYISNKFLREKIGTNFYLAQLEKKIKELLDYLNDSGFFFASVKILKANKTDKGIKITLEISEGKYCKFEKFIFKGNKISTNRSLLRISGLNSTKKITPSVLDLAKENILRQSYIKDCEILPLNHKEILISIKENKMNYFSGIAGYDNKSKKANRFTGFVNFTFLNIAGEGRSISFRWKNIPSKIKSVKIAYKHPYILQYPIGFEIMFHREEKDYIKSETESKIYYTNFNYKSGISFSYEYVYSKGGENYFEREKRIKPGFWTEINNTDSFFNPRKGNRFFFHYYVVLNQNNKKQAIETNYEKFFPLKRNLVYYIKATIKVKQNKDLNYFDYFHLGGLKSVRGFLEDNFSGYRVGWLNNEIRLIVGRESSFFFFTDYGYVKNLDITKGKLFGVGLGLRLGTKLGVFEFDYGLGYQNDRFSSPMDGIIHFGISSGL